MSMTQTEKLGFGKNMVELIEKETVVLENAGFKAGKVLASLTDKLETAAAANARQEELKRASKQATEDLEARLDDLYRAASGYLDAAIAAVGKGSDAAKNFQRLRSRVRRPDQGEETPAQPALAAQTPGLSPAFARLHVCVPGGHSSAGTFFFPP